MGSSPLARGLRRAGDRLELHLGIIPARAGFTSPTPSVSSRSRDHPRSRGVYAHACMGIHSMIGSSPLARGLPLIAVGPAGRRGIIPARAGFTVAGHTGFGDDADHPRSRGVYLLPREPRTARGGSSPLARGLLGMGVRAVLGPGIIPARAGFTPGAAGSSPPSTDHPRSRGVYTCGSLVSQRTRSLPDPRRLHCRPRACSAGSP